MPLVRFEGAEMVPLDWKIRTNGSDHPSQVSKAGSLAPEKTMSAKDFGSRQKNL